MNSNPLLLRFRRAALAFGAVLALGPLSACVVADPTIADEYEPNDTAVTPADLGDFSDQGTNQSFPLTLHTANDEDWFLFHVSDRGLDGNPDVSIDVDGDGSDLLEMTATFTCDGDPTGTVVGQPVNADPRIGFTTSCPSGGFFDDDDSGTVLLHIKHHGAKSVPSSYRLRIAVD